MTHDTGTPEADSSERRVLVVDDERSVRESIARFLKARGFEVGTADTVSAALEQVRTSRYATLISDVRMPGASGIELVPEALRIDADLAILMLTGLNDAGAATEALTQGAMDYLLKPIELDRLEDAIAHALRRRRERMERRNVERPIQDVVAARTAAIEQQNRQLEQVTVSAFEAIVTMLEAKSPHRAGHAQRVAELAGAVATTMGLAADAVMHIQTAARLHDIGNLAVSESILFKATALTAREHADVRRHVRAGIEILAPINALGPVLPFIGDHHERWSGGGYPADIKGQSISIGGRILAAADAFVAVTSGRAYLNPLPPAGALAHLAPHAGTHFDPDVFRSLQHAVRGRLS